VENDPAKHRITSLSQRGEGNAGGKEIPRHFSGKKRTLRKRQYLSSLSRVALRGKGKRVTRATSRIQKKIVGMYLLGKVPEAGGSRDRKREMNDECEKRKRIRWFRMETTSNHVGRRKTLKDAVGERGLRQSIEFGSPR